MNFNQDSIIYDAQTLFFFPHSLAPTYFHSTENRFITTAAEPVTSDSPDRYRPLREKNSGRFEMVLMLLMSWALCIKTASECSSVCLSQIRDRKWSWCGHDVMGCFFFLFVPPPLPDFTGCVLQRTDTLPGG